MGMGVTVGEWETLIEVRYSIDDNIAPTYRGR